MVQSLLCLFGLHTYIWGFDRHSHRVMKCCHSCGKTYSEVDNKWIPDFHINFVYWEDFNKE